MAKNDRASSGQEPDVAAPGSGLASVTQTNEVHLVGRISTSPEERELPSGAVIATFRLVVVRAAGAAGGSRAQFDVIDCVIWSSALRRRSGRWRVGDVLDVEGALRRRFYRTPTGTASRTEVEVLRARLLRRAAA